MVEVVRFVKNKTALLCAIILAAIIGGATSAVVLAAIPDSNGTINGCYSKITGQLRVINAPSQNCNGLENSLSWAQNGGSPAYAHIEYNSSSNTYSVDSDLSKNITFLQIDPVDMDQLCFMVNFTPKNISYTPTVGAGFPSFISIKGPDGWTDTGGGSPDCGSVSGANVQVSEPAQSFYLQFN
jgi:hypothetical protein